MVELTRRRFLALTGPALTAVFVAARPKPRPGRTATVGGYGMNYGMSYGG